MDEFEDDYSADPDPSTSTIDVAALLNDRITTLLPADPVCMPASATVQEAVGRMLGRRHSGVLVVDAAGHLAGIFTERDVLTRVVGRELDPRSTTLETVMTAKPEALFPEHRVAYAVHCMSVAGYRTIPLVDHQHRPIGIVTVSDFIRWLANLFPETILNLPPGDRLKHPGEIDAG